MPGSIVSVRLLAAILLGLLLAQLAGLPRLGAQTPQPSPPPAAEASSEPALPADIAAALDKASSTLSEVSTALRNITGGDSELAALRAKVEAELGSADEIAGKLRPRLEGIKSDIAKLGPAPKDGAEETQEIAAERSRLAALAAVYDGGLKSSDLIVVRARRQIERIAGRRHALFTKNLMQRLPSPLTPDAWREIGASTESVGNPFAMWAEHWWEMARPKRTPLGFLMIGTALLYAALRLALTRLSSRPAWAESRPPAFFQRAASAVRVAAVRQLPLLAAGLALYAGLDALALLEGNPWGRLFPTALAALLVVAAISKLVRAVLAPDAPCWRLVDLADRPARRLTWLLGAMAAVYALDGVLTEAARAFYLPLALSVAQSTASSLIFIVLLIGVLLTPFAPQVAGTPGAFSRQHPRWLKLPLWALAAGIVGAALLGYAALARFISQQLLLTGTIALVVWLGHLAIRAFTREPAEQGRAFGNVLEQQFGIERTGRRQLARLTELTLTFALVLCALPFILLQWGFSAADIRDWTESLLFGFEIGQVRISLVRILLGIVLFIALLFAIRLFQRWLRNTMLEPHMGAGVANSVEAVAGYALTALAALIAVSYAGFDITSLAIVAGALSLGIGFGLQSIFNNFVSGLILLIERPIKVGDRLLVGDQQGFVRRINVRATEIETFDRVSLIIPNSELITGRVMNWTHRDPTAAAGIAVRAPYSADPEQVAAILVKCAEEHPKVLRTPAPAAYLVDFGTSALLFNLRITLPDVALSYGVQSELRIAILKALRAANIDIPFDQIDVNMRHPETIRRRLNEA